jgi:hypothetical protein
MTAKSNQVASMRVLKTLRLNLRKIFNDGFEAFDLFCSDRFSRGAFFARAGDFRDVDLAGRIFDTL